MRLLLALTLATLPVAGFAFARKPTSTHQAPLASSADATRVASPTGPAASGSWQPFESSAKAAVASDGALISRTGRGTFTHEGVVAGTITLGSGHEFDPLGQGEPPIPAELTAGPLEPGEVGSFLVQLEGPVAAGQREQIEATGARLFGYLPENTFLARMRAEESAAVAALPFVRWVGTYQPAYKISFQPETQGGSGPGTLVVLLFPEADLAVERAALQAMGGTIHEATDSGRNKILRATLDMGRLPEIAARGGVAWVEPWHQPTFENATAQWVVQTNILNNRRIWDMGLDGEGQVVHISDSGIRTSHNAFRDEATAITTFGEYPTHRKIIAYLVGSATMFGDHAGASNHGTHVAGTVAGDDSPFAGDLRDGHALKAKIYFTDVGNTTTSVFVPTDMNLVFGPAYAGNAGGAARISTNSWGSLVNEYDVQSRTVDQFMRNHSDFLVFFANGNSAGPGTVGSPAGNKNGLGIGNCQNGANANQKSATSSEGPTADGRQKPTIMAPGQSIQSADGAGDAGYKSLTGTSMASPAAAGATTLIRQYLTEGWYPTGTPTPAHAFTPSGALLKAMAISSTDNDMLGHNVPDFTVGWGRIKLDNVLYFPGDAVRTALVDEPQGVATGEFVDYQVSVTDPAVPLKITLCWTDREALPGAGIKLINDLDLTVTDPNGLVYRGNAMASGESQLAGATDRLNVEEGVRRNAPVAGIWTIRVAGFNVPFAPQPFALAVTGGVGAASGIVRIDRQTYGRSDVIQVRVEDLNASAGIQVAYFSTTQLVPETVTLSGSGGVFTGSIPTTAFAPQPNDGLLSVSHGDLITVRYFDEDPVGETIATARADFDGPIITEVRAEDQGAYQNIVWTTDVLSTSRVYYGVTPSLGQASALDPGLGTFHSVPLTNLLPETQYWFDVEAFDHGGNPTRDDNGGEHYRFATGKKGEILVALGDGSFMAADLYTTALRERGWSPAFLAGGSLTTLPLGNRDAGLRSYPVVWWQGGLEQYPPFQDQSRTSLTDYMNGGGRLAVTGHDIAWALTDLASGHANAERTAWLANTLHLQFLEDPLAWAVNMGVAGDPISGEYIGGVAYAPHRAGAAGDEVAIVPGTGTGSYTWTNTDATPGNIGFRWENGVPNGNPADAVWGGTPSKLVYNGFEWSGITDAAARTDILDKTLIWLIGRDHPDVTVQGPNGGELVTGDQVSISWTETAYGGAAVASRSVFYSGDGGSSWNLIATGAAASPFVWNVSGLPNGATYRVRVEVADDGNPALTGRDVSDADFTLNRPAGDGIGPVVVAGSIKMNPNPMDNRSSPTLTASLTDQGHGGSNVAAAEYSWGELPQPAGTGKPMSGAFTAPTVNVSASVPPRTVPVGERTFWVRGRDAAGNWGPASGRTVVVNGDATVDVGDAPVAFDLHQNIPNPANGSTAIGFALPRPDYVELVVFGVRGERVRTLVSGPQMAGRRTVSWDGRDDAGRIVPNGVYFYRLVAGERQARRKLVLLR